MKMVTVGRADDLFLGRVRPVLPVTNSMVGLLIISEWLLLLHCFDEAKQRVTCFGPFRLL